MKIDYEKIQVNNISKKQTISSYLKSLNYSENFLKNLRKQEGFIKLNGKVCFINEHIKNGDIIEINNNPNTKSSITPCIIPLNIVYEDEYMLIINKPSGLATMPSKSHYTNNLSGAILHYMQQKNPNFVIRINTRLDKDTAGLVVVSKNSLICNYFNNSNVIKKTYYALCQGNKTDSFVIDYNIETIQDENGINQNKRVISKDKGKPAKTFVYPIRNFDNYFLAKINLEHGRTHQIRVHLSSVNHPLLGDELYGEKSQLISHTALLCKSIEFIHPKTNKLMNFEVDFPDDFKLLIKE